MAYNPINNNSQHKLASEEGRRNYEKNIKKYTEIHRVNQNSVFQPKFQPHGTYLGAGGVYSQQDYSRLSSVSGNSASKYDTAYSRSNSPNFPPKPSTQRSPNFIDQIAPPPIPPRMTNRAKNVNVNKPPIPKKQTQISDQIIDIDQKAPFTKKVLTAAEIQAQKEKEEKQQKDLDKLKSFLENQLYTPTDKKVRRRLNNVKNINRAFNTDTSSESQSKSVTQNNLKGLSGKQKARLKNDRKKDQEKDVTKAEKILVPLGKFLTYFLFIIFGILYNATVLSMFRQIYYSPADTQVTNKICKFPELGAFLEYRMVKNKTKYRGYTSVSHTRLESRKISKSLGRKSSSPNFFQRSKALALFGLLFFALFDWLFCSF